MAGDLSWFTTLLVGIVVVLTLLVALVLLPRIVRTGIQTARLYCPWVRREVTVQHLTDDVGDPITVISCTGFADATIATCERQCLGGVAETA